MSEKFVSRNELLEKNYRRRAESGDIFCMHKLGSLLESRGEIDPKSGAEYWYRRAIQLGSKAGQKKLDALLSGTANFIDPYLKRARIRRIRADVAQVDEYELRVQAESGDSTDSYKFGMHLKNNGALSGGAHGAEYWFRRARDQGHPGAATELELVKTQKALKYRLKATALHANGESTFDDLDFFKDPFRRGERLTVSDLWLEKNALLATEKWLTEIIDRAEFMRKYLRKSVDKKFALELADNVVLSVELFGNIVTGHLESRKKLIKVKFDLDSLEIMKPINSSQERLAFGLALSWFIDLSIVLKNVKTTSSIFMMKPSGTRLENSNPKNVGVRYVPTPYFYLAQLAIGKGEGVKRVIHSVAGHLRTLGHGMKPSSEARDRAPKYLRSQMRRNETFVQPHSRGEDEDRREYEIRLSKYSACAHALVELKV